MVSAAVVVLCASVAALVPYSFYLVQRLGFFLGDVIQQLSFDLFAPFFCSFRFYLQGFEQQGFFARHDIGDVLEALCGMFAGIDVYMQSALLENGFFSRETAPPLWGY